MKQIQKVKSLISRNNRNNKLLSSLLIWLGWILCFGTASILITPNAFWQSSEQNITSSFYYTWVDNNRDVVYHLYFVSKDNLSNLVNEMFIKKNSNRINFHMSWNSVVIWQYKMNGSLSPSTWTENSKNSNILTWNDNTTKVDSNNITIIGWRDNIISKWNDNATVLWWMGNKLDEWNNKWAPAVMIWGSGNSIWKNQNGTVIIWGENNKIWDNITNSQIFGWKNNTVKVSGSMVAWKNVNNDSASNSFVFSNSEKEFSPKTSNAFYLNVEKWVWLNMKSLAKWISSSGVVSVWWLDKTGCVSINDVWLQWVLSGCLVWCTRYSFSNWRTYELLDTSKECLKRFNKQPKKDPNAFSGSCYTWSLDLTNATLCGRPELYTNTIFEALLIDITDQCPSSNNNCAFKCNEWYHLIDGKCHKDCTRDWKTIVHNATGIWYNIDSTTCTGTCTSNNHSKVLTCNDGNLWEANYEHSNCELNNFKCDLTEFPLNTKTSNWNYTSCRDYNPEGNYKCIEGDLHYKLNYCNKNYYRSDNECIACPDGYGTSSTGSTSISQCCRTVPNKQHIKTGWWTPENCDKGRYKGEHQVCANDTSNCYLCTEIDNRYSWTSNWSTANNCGFTCKAWYKYNGTNRTCTACENGSYTTNWNTSTSCSPCTNKPDHSRYTSNWTNNNCSWVCEDGYIEKNGKCEIKNQPINWVCHPYNIYECSAWTPTDKGSFHLGDTTYRYRTCAWLYDGESEDCSDSYTNDTSCNCGYYKNGTSCSACAAWKYSTAWASSCSNCTWLPDNAEWTSNACTNSCSWACKQGYHKNTAGTACEKDSTPDPCANYTLTSCPTGRSCSTCPSNNKKFKKDNCACGYYGTSCSACAAWTYSAAWASSCSNCTWLPDNAEWTSNACTNSCSWACKQGYKETNGTCVKPVNWSCSSSHYNCTAWTATDKNNWTTAYTWTCQWSNGWSNAACSETKSVSCVEAGSCPDTAMTNSESQSCSGLYTWVDNQWVTCYPAGCCGTRCRLDSNWYMQCYR